MKKGKGWVRLFALAAVCGAVLGGGTNVYANAPGNITITYTKEESEAYVLSLEVKGDGRVSDGKDSIRNGKKNYLVTVGGSITFELHPDQGSGIEKVVLNGEAVTSQVSKNKITVKGQAKGQAMEVRFCTRQAPVKPPQKPQQAPGGSQQSSHGSGSGVKTGDESRAGLYALLAAAAAGTGWGLSDKRKKDRGHSEEGGQQGE